MNEVVRKAPEESVLSIGGGDPIEAKKYRKGPIIVERRLALGVEPRLQLSWAVAPSYWLKGFSLLLFRNFTGFTTNRDTHHLPDHGNLIAEANHDDMFDEVCAEGTHYFTFVLYKRGWFGVTEKLMVLRFTETIPSAKLAISRIKDQVELKELIHGNEIGDIEHKAKLNEAKLRRLDSKRRLKQARRPVQNPAPSKPNATIGKVIEGVDLHLDIEVAKQAKLLELQRSDKFKGLPPKVQEELLKKIESDFDPGEISARDEQGM